MKLKELILKYEWNQVENTYKKLYPDYERYIVGISKAFNELKKISKKKLIETEFSIVVEFVEKSELSDESFYIVSGNKIGSEDIYSLAYTEWQEWLNMEIKETNLNESEILSHILWEMTFLGFSNKLVKKRIKNFFRNLKKEHKRNIKESEKFFENFI